MSLIEELTKINWLLYILIILVSYLIISHRRLFYWVNKGIPYDIPIPFIGCTKWLSFVGSDLYQNEIKYYKKYGPVYGYIEGGVPCLNLGIPELAQQVFVKDFLSFQNRPFFPNPEELNNYMLFDLRSDAWRRIRSIVTPTFTSGKMRKMTALISECLVSLTESISDAIPKNKTLDMKRFFGAFTMDVVASTAFATKIDSHKNPDNPFVTNASAFFTSDLSYLLPFIFAFPNAFYYIGSLFPSLNLLSFDFFKDITYKILQDRKNNAKKGVDFIQLLLDAQNELGLNEDGTAKISLSDKEMLAQAITFFIVGYDTTATSISLTAHLIAKHPRVQEKLFEEIERVLKENNGQIDYDTVNKMEYLDACFSETLRLYPAVAKLDREANEDYVFPTINIPLKKGMRISVPVAGMQLDPKNFEKPMEYIPERFLPDSKLHFNQHAYMPFGVGPRMCVAIRFARMEAKMCLATAINKYHFKIDPAIGDKLEWLTGTFLLQAKSVPLIVEERKSV